MRRGLPGVAGRDGGERIMPWWVIILLTVDQVITAGCFFFTLGMVKLAKEGKL
jgi:hypothetical protein